MVDAQTCLVAIIAGLILITVVLLFKRDEIGVWCTRKIDQQIKTHQTKLQSKDVTNPERVKQRARLKMIRDKIGMYAFFFTALILFPIGVVALGLQQRSVGNEVWVTIIVAAVQGVLAELAVIIGATIKKDDQESDSESTEL